ncbi:MAG TPA: MurR/RpiR family transcriptional regulator [Firmicutes bacterium]|nr:MurR/RpiR family transcriptional regulator [Bacillota bacterium]
MNSNDVSLEARIKRDINEFSEAQRALAEFLLSNYDQAAFLTAARVGALVGVSESTVVRFAYAIGYQGWPQLQTVLQDMVRDRLSTATRLRMSASGDQGKNQSVMREVMETDLENLRRSLQDLKEETFNAAVEAVIQSENIYVLGSRSAHSLAHFLAFYLQMIGKCVHVIPQGLGSIFEELAPVKPKDLVIGISFPRYTRIVVEGFAYARSKGAKTLALTDNVISPLGQMADITLTATSNLGSFIESFVAPLSVVNALLTAVGRRDKDKTLTCLDELEEIAQKHDVFYLPGGGSNNII